MICLSALLAITSLDIDLFSAVLTLEESNSTGMKAISEVIWNRSNHNPLKVRGVLLKKWQFSCLNSHTVKGKSLTLIIERAKKRSNWSEAKRISQRVLCGVVTNIVGDSTHYHVYTGKYKVQPYWTHASLGGKNKSAKIVRTIGNHVFLKDVD